MNIILWRKVLFSINYLQYRTDYQKNSDGTYLVKLNYDNYDNNVRLKVVSMWKDLYNYDLISSKNVIIHGILLETDSIDEARAFEKILEMCGGNADGSAVEIIPNITIESPNYYGVKTASSYTSTQDGLLNKILGVNYNAQITNESPGSFIYNNISLETARGISKILNEKNLPAKVYYPILLYITDLGNKENEIRNYLSNELSLTDTDANTIMNYFASSGEALIYSGDIGDINEIIAYRDGINTLGGTAEIRNVCWITVSGDDGIVDVPSAITYGEDFDIYVNKINPGDYSALNDYNVFINGVSIRDTATFTLQTDTTSGRDYVTIPSLTEDVFIEVKRKENAFTYTGPTNTQVVYTYDGKEKTMMEYFELNPSVSLENGDVTFLYNGSEEKPINPGSYDLEVEVVNQHYNYDLLNTTFVIQKADLVVKPKDIDAIVGADTVEFETEYIGFFSGDETKVTPKNTLEYRIVNNGQENNLQPVVYEWTHIKNTAGTYSIIYNKKVDELFDTNDLYNISLGFGKLRVNKIPVTVMPKEINITAGEDINFETKLLGVLAGDTVTPNEDYAYQLYEEDNTVGATVSNLVPVSVDYAKMNPGEYIIKHTNAIAGLFGNNPKYAFEFEENYLTVQKKNLEIKIKDIETTVGADVEVEFEYDGLIFGDTFDETNLEYEILSNDKQQKLLTLDEALSQGGEYIIRFTTNTENLLSQNARYNITPSNGSLKVNKIPVTLTPTDIEITAGEDIKFATEITGVLDEDKDTVTPNEEYAYKLYKEDNSDPTQLSYDEISIEDAKMNASEYIIRHTNDIADLFDANPKYSFEFADGKLTVNKKALTITLKDISTTVGKDVEIEIEYDGLISGDAIDETTFEYDIFSVNDENPNAPTMLELDEAIQNAGEYLISFQDVTLDEFRDNPCYEITVVEPATLTVGNPPAGNATAFTIKVKENANIEVEPGMSVIVRKGADKTFTFDAKDGYEITDVLINRESVGAVSEYTFKAVKKDYTIEVKTVKIEDEKDDNSSDKDFYIDVSRDDWFYEEVKYVTENEIMNGTGGNKYSPYLDTTRGMIVTILYRLEGKPEIIERSTFTDVEENMWYTDAISWGEKHGIVLGYGDGTFGPTDNITREQLSAIMHRYANYKGYNTEFGDYEIPYDGKDEISGYAVTPMTWACKNELIRGMGNNELNPRTGATRAQVATVLTRFCKMFVD